MDYPISEPEAAGLRSQDRLGQLRAQAHSVSQRVLLRGGPEALWPVLAFTDLLNQAVGMQQTQTSYLNRDYGGTWMHAQTQNSGLAVAYEELPYEWEAPQRYRVERIHSKGPLKYLSFGVELNAVGTDQTEAVCTLRYVSILPKAVAGLLIKKEIAKFIRQFEALSAARAAGVPALQAYFTPLGAARQQIEAWSRDWQDLVPEAPVRLALADYIARAPERLAYRLRPFELAAAYGLDPLEVLKACLRLSREGLLQLLWDCRCPGCKGPKESFQDLKRVRALAYCPTCAVSYGLAFDQNLELSFQPARALRVATDRYFCAGSPGNTPHIAWQQNFAPGEQRDFRLGLAPGPYALRSLSSANELLLMIGPDQQEQEGEQGQQGQQGQDLPASLEIALGEGFELVGNTDATGTQAEDVIWLSPGPELRIHNRKGHEVTLMLENLHWRPEAVTAARVQAVQAFHDLFPEQILAAGEALPLQAQIFLRVEVLTGREQEHSTGEQAMDEQSIGEALAGSLDGQLEANDSCDEILAWIQSRIQQHEGAALGQEQEPAALPSHGPPALLGIFATGFEALAAAWGLCQELETINLLADQPLRLGLGVASGPCEVFVEAGRLAYRGPALARVTEAAGLSHGEGIVISEDLLAAPEMQVFLDDPQLYREPLASDAAWVRLRPEHVLAELSL